ncbi:MAG: hypothetical protein K8R89_07045 [Anaerolineae bacterium]|nr:hypothetical protein [Anaerolineae bacterium]
MREIPSILNRIAQLLDTCDYPDRKKINSLRKWGTNLLSVSSNQEELEILSTIQKVIAGMNSLSDIRLLPPVYSGMLASEANQQLYGMIVELDNLVRKKLKL